jgi:hypothetical protein
VKKNFVFNVLLSGNLVLSAVSVANTDFAETDANAIIKVKQSIVLKKDRDLVFSDAVQGDAQPEVLGATSQSAASFTVSGQPGRTYVVSFKSSSIFMTTGKGDTTDSQIQVDNFTTDLSNGLGTLDSTTGKQTFGVGATRAAISPTQIVADDYKGIFTVRVTYQ